MSFNMTLEFSVTLDEFWYNVHASAVMLTLFPYFILSARTHGLPAAGHLTQLSFDGSKRCGPGRLSVPPRHIWLMGELEPPRTRGLVRVKGALCYNCRCL